MNTKVQLLDTKADAVRQNFPVHVFLSDFLALVKTFHSQEQELIDIYIYILVKVLLYFSKVTNEVCYHHVRLLFQGGSIG